MIPLLQLKQPEKNKLISSLKKITNYFNEKKNCRKKKNEINSKMLINKQIIEEIKRRRDEEDINLLNNFNILRNIQTNNSNGQRRKNSDDNFKGILQLPSVLKESSNNFDKNDENYELDEEEKSNIKKSGRGRTKRNKKDENIQTLTLTINLNNNLIEKNSEKRNSFIDDEKSNVYEEDIKVDNSIKKIILKMTKNQEIKKIIQ